MIYEHTGKERNTIHFKALLQACDNRLRAHTCGPFVWFAQSGGPETVCSFDFSPYQFSVTLVDLAHSFARTISRPMNSEESFHNIALQCRETVDRMIADYREVVPLKLEPTQ